MRLSSLLTVAFAVGCGGQVAPTSAQDASPASDTTGFDIPSTDIIPPGPVFSSLEVTPNGATLFLDRAGGGSKPAVQAYRAILHHDDGTATDVTDSSTFSLGDPSLGVFSGATLNTVSGLPDGAHGATTLVLAQDGATTGAAAVTLVQLDRSMDFLIDVPCCGTPSPSRQVIRSSAGKTPLDVSMVLSMESTADMLTPSSFLKSVRAMSEGDAKSGCLPRAAKDTDGDGIEDTFPLVAPGAVVCFEVTPKPVGTVKPGGFTRFYALFADVTGDPGAVKMERHMLVFLVPPNECCGGK
jgi:hypothetical protein